MILVRVQLCYEHFLKEVSRIGISPPGEDEIRITNLPCNEWKCERTAVLEFWTVLYSSDTAVLLATMSGIKDGKR